MPVFSDVGLAEPSTITNKVGAVTLTRNTTNVQQEILCLGDPDTTNAIAAVLAATPGSTAWGLAVREVVPQSTGPFQLSSLAGRVLVDQNSTTWAVQLTQYSTIVAVSSVAGAVDVRPVAGSTFAVRPLQSSAADLQVTATPASTVWAVQVDGRVRAQNSTIGDLLASVQQNSTVWAVQLTQYSTITAVSSLGGVVTAALVSSSNVSMSTDAAPASTKQGLIVRQVFPTLLSTGRSTVGNNSTRETLVSSVAAQRVKVYAYSITSTAQAINDVSFFSSNANLIWPIVLQSISSAVTGANLAVTPPAWLFATDAANALTFGITGTTGTYKVGVSYFQEA